MLLSQSVQAPPTHRDVERENMSIHIEISQGLRVDNLTMLQEKVRLHGGHLIAYSQVVSVIFYSARNYTVKWIAEMDGENWTVE